MGSSTFDFLPLPVMYLVAAAGMESNSCTSHCRYGVERSSRLLYALKMSETISCANAPSSSWEDCRVSTQRARSDWIDSFGMSEMATLEI